MTKRPLLPLRYGLLLLPLWLAGCDAPTAKVADVRQVRTRIIATRKHEDPVVLSGLVAAHTYVNAAFRTSGKVVERSVSVGDRVTAGQALARLDDTLEREALAGAEAEVAAAKAFLEQAESAEKRAGLLVKDKAVSQNDYDQALRQLKAARAQVDGAEAKKRAAQEQLDYTLLVATTSGLVVDKLVEVGDVVAAGHPVFRLADTGATDAVFDLPEALLRQGVAVGQKIDVCLNADRTICASGTIYEKAPQADPMTRTYPIKAALEAPPASLLLGAVVVGTLTLPEEPSLRLPAAALTSSNGKPAVWRVDPVAHTVLLTPVTVERYTTDAVVIASGLQDGAIVVTAGTQALYPNQKVRWQGDQP
jgi:RND family efflux transporter MFP subunit